MNTLCPMLGNQNEKIANISMSEEYHTIPSTDKFSIDITKKTINLSLGRIMMKSNLNIYLSFKIRTPKATAASKCKATVMDIDHVYVPTELRGSRLAELLAKKAFCLAETKGWMIQPTCSYIRQTFLIRNPEYNSKILVKDFTVNSGPSNNSFRCAVKPVLTKRRRLNTLGSKD